MADTQFRVQLDHEGPEVIDVQSRLLALGLLDFEPTGKFDVETERAVRAFQQQRGLLADGVIGPRTFRALEEARWRLGDRLLVFVAGNPLVGDDVVALQQRLLDLGFNVGRVDGHFGAKTASAVKEFQRNLALRPDGTCGPSTLNALRRLSPIVQGGQPNAMRAQERLRREGPRLAGKVIVLDPGVSTAADPALRRQADEISYDVAKRVEGRLVVLGVQAFLTHRGDRVPDEVAIAEFANRLQAHAVLSLRVDTSTNPEARGVSSYYYGVDAHGVRSTVGERLAGLIQREILARTHAVDLRTHARAFDLLRLTRMPTVTTEMGYLTNPSDAELLSDPTYRDTLAEAAVVAFQRLYLAPEDDAHTGLLRLDELNKFIEPTA